MGPSPHDRLLEGQPLALILIQFLAILFLPVLLLAPLCRGQSGRPSSASGQVFADAPESTFFSTAAEESYSTYQLPGDGDLWPSCWADDGNLYTANGDGVAFTQAKHLFDMAVSRIRGVPPDLQGETVASDIGANWSGPRYNRKPTGMLCIHGDIYLAFQNLALDTFSDAPAASIARSTDHGLTWKWDAAAPMFGSPANPDSPVAHKFTTLFFLDYGRDSAHAIDRYVYVYGLDDNWRSQQALYLARVPADAIQTRARWEFYRGIHRNGQPMWSHNLIQKAPVLTDRRTLYPKVSGKTCSSRVLADHRVIGQGGVVYDAPLRRYLFTSWSCATHEFYEAPQPWGPWRHFLSKDFGPLRNSRNYGQYGTSIPSKFISGDGKTLYLQSNVWVNAYTFALRKIYLEPYVSTLPANGPSNVDLASARGTRAISKSTQWGSLCGVECSDQLSSGPLTASEDDFDMEAKTTDWWGYVWPRPYKINRVVYRTGAIDKTGGGWFQGELRIQVRQHFKWVDVPGAAISPHYPYSAAAGSHVAYTFSFADTWGDGVRIIGVPGGVSHFTSISRLAIFYDGVPTAEHSGGTDGLDNLTSSRGNLEGR